MDDEGSPSLFAPIMIATLSTCAQLERDNTSFRLQSGRKRYIEKGGKLGRKIGSVKTEKQIRTDVWAANRFAPQKIFHSGCGEAEW